MDCDCEVEPLEVETEQAIYEIVFGQIQVEITGRCNQLCRHCRAAGDLKRDMPVEQVLKIINFGRRYSPDYKEILLSGGEPLLHNDFARLLAGVRETVAN